MIMSINWGQTILLIRPSASFTQSRIAELAVQGSRQGYPRIPVRSLTVYPTQALYARNPSRWPGTNRRRGDHPRPRPSRPYRTMRVFTAPRPSVITTPRQQTRATTVILASECFTKCNGERSISSALASPLIWLTVEVIGVTGIQRGFRTPSVRNVLKGMRWPRRTQPVQEDAYAKGKGKSTAVILLALALIGGPHPHRRAQISFVY